MGKCADKVRFTLSDKTGDLRFTAFDIVNAPECTELAEELRAKLLGRCFAEINMAGIQRMSCRGDGQCMQTVVSTIMEYQDLFCGPAGKRECMGKQAESLK